MEEDVDYKLIKGKRWLPIGRKYQLINPILHYSGIIIPVGFIWDGGTGVSMSFNDPATYAFLCHDYDFGSGATNVIAANSQCVQQLYKDTNLLLSMIIALWFTLLIPTIYTYYVAETMQRFKFIRIIAHVIGVLNVMAIGWVVWQILV